MAEWDVLLKDQHEGYISWSEFEKNQQVITDNATGQGSAVVSGAVRRGEPLLAGLLRCGHCTASCRVRPDRAGSTCSKPKRSKIDCTKNIQFVAASATAEPEWN
jgi:hypothetical protein